MNPFRFGAIVEGEHFTNRRQEIKELVSDIESGQNVVLISQRRYGKSSMVNKALAGMDIKSIRLDLEIISDEIDLANAYVKKALALSPFEKLKTYLKSLKIQPAMEYNPATGEMNVSFSPTAADKSSVIAESLELPEVIAKKQNRRIVVVFDEFQEIRRISPNLEKKMRGVFQAHQNVSYIFIGSQESMIRDIFQEKKNPFYKFGRQKVLGGIPEKEMEDFVLKRFASAGINAVGIVKDILAFTGCHPYYTQQLCHELYITHEKGLFRRELIKEAIGNIVIQHNADYKRWWNGLDNTERKIVIGLAAGGSAVTSQQFIQKYGIKTVSTSGSAIGRLIDKGIIVRRDKNAHEIEDPFWKEWIISNRN
ncbi:MAG: hypothetical protein A2X28_09045 [Elusimicrobia bacterium GWA2_56_46]|nr:MAG: hypothetical protein A2X28_09045 [Elusimicrobia bacterium GWA2_56_46]OGR54449.1 MAG: hypothetical protein A2X39_04125 [Elusimicrobia bacterium GWC2_56_31]HBB67011.1 hypothetical protein [Elusimicrobiota bacterium]HBW22571.1 hypothetical protein [Elusimicrobiota bacterium]